MTGKPGTRWLALLPVLAVLACLPALQGYFLGDDYNLLLGLERHGLTGFAWSARGDEGALRFWRPLSFSALGLEHLVFGWHASGYLAVGLLLHLAVVYLCFRLYRRHLPPVAVGVATMLFALHPRHLEAFAWISAQPDVWAAAGLLLALLAWTPQGLGPAEFPGGVHRAERTVGDEPRPEDTERWGRGLPPAGAELSAARPQRGSGPFLPPAGAEQSGAHRARRPGLALLFGAAALLSKEAALSLPLLAAWLDQEGSLKARVRRAAPLFALALVFVIARSMVLGGLGGYGAGTHLRPGPVALLKPIATFTAALLLPFHPGAWADGLTRVLKARPAVFLVLGGLTALVLAGTAWRLVRRLEPGERRRWLLFAGAFLISLVPFYNLAVSLSGRADRYLYLPSIWFCGLAGLVVARVTRERTGARVGLVGLLALLLTGGLFQLAMSYRTAGRLARAVVTGVVEAARATNARKLYVAGVPDRFNGVGVLFTGLQKVVPAWSGKEGLEVIIAARTELRWSMADELEDFIVPSLKIGREYYGNPAHGAIWTVRARADGMHVVGETVEVWDCLLEGGMGWGDWKPGAMLSRTRKRRLELPYRADGVWLAVEGVDRVRELSTELTDAASHTPTLTPASVTATAPAGATAIAPTTVPVTAPFGAAQQKGEKP